MTRVAHFVRAWLRPTETFVWGPIRHHTRHEPVVLARDSLPSAPPCDLELHIAAREMARPARAWAELQYRAYRGLATAERRFYARTLHRTGCALVHAHFATDARYVLPAVCDAGLPLVTTVLGYDYSRFPDSYGGLGHRYLQPLFARGARFLAVAGAVRDGLLALGCAPDRIVVLPFGIDTDLFAPAAVPRTTAGCVFLMVSGFTKKKGVGTLIRAFDRLRRELPDAQLVLAGAGPERAAAESLVRDLGLTECVRMPGFVAQADLPDLYRRCDVFVHPSETPRDGDKEGTPTVIMEAMACGLPVLSTLHAGIPELVADGVSGRLVPERDITALAACMGELARHADRRRAFGAAGRRRIVADYNVRTQTARLEDVYEDVLARESGAAVRATV